MVRFCVVPESTINVIFKTIFPASTFALNFSKSQNVGFREAFIAFPKNANPNSHFFKCNFQN